MVPHIQTILFATDLTENSRHAFRYASSLAARYGGRILLFHVIERLPQGVKNRLDVLVGEGTAQKFSEAREREARAVLIGKRRDDADVRRALAEFYGGAEEEPGSSSGAFDLIIKEGRVEDEILKLAEENQCDLIVLGSHKGLLRGTAIGGSTKYVLHQSKIPVLIVPPPEAAE
jgi:nucleotide-binding universal stress UspA family protein